jgi:phage-related protein
MLPGRRIMLLHSFLKKTPNMPPCELAVAYRRLKEVRSEDEGEQ